MSDFSAALTAVKAGGKQVRATWPAGSFLFLMPSSTVTVSGTVITQPARLSVRNVDLSVSAWSAPQSDILATDWSAA